MISEASRERPEKQMTSEDFELVARRVGHPQRVDDDPVVGEKFDKIGAAEGGRILVLLAAGELEIDALDLERQVRYVVLPQRCREQQPEGVDQGHDERRGRAETRAQGRIDGGGDRRRDRLAGIVVAHHALIDAAMQQ